jgi:hypothetical protein
MPLRISKFYLAVLLAIPFLVFLFLPTFFSKTDKLDSGYEQVNLIIDNRVKINALVAITPDQQSLGLGKRGKLASDTGMLFPFNPKSTPVFWMKDMNFPIDIIWISDNKVVGIEKNVPNPPPAIRDYQLPRYSPPVPIDFALEVNAGFADKNNITTNQSIVVVTGK